MDVKFWPVLVVDDEPDVLAISKMILKGIKCYGIPTKVFTCTSKAEALEFFKKSETSFGSDLCVAFIDIVMETDEAGLELCDYIRGDLKNKSTQLIVRSGQPGQYPEKEVIDKFQISGYVDKVSATDDLLYTLTKSAIRNHIEQQYSAGNLQFIQMLFQHTNSRESMVSFFKQMVQQMGEHTDGTDLEYRDNTMFLRLGQHEIGAGSYGKSTAEANQEIEKILKLEPAIKTEKGDCFYDTADYSLYHLGGNGPEEDRLQILYRTNFEWTDTLYMCGLMTFDTIRNIWARYPK